MHLLNFCVGRIQSVQIGTEGVRTAHLKGPVGEPWVITEDGAQGDQRAVHPDKLYAFARSAYDYWGRQLGVDPANWSDGFFGENLTLDVLYETDIRVGDVFRLGEKVRLVVSGARTPCAKLAWRLDQPRSFQKTFARSRNSGVYLSVIQPGTVRPGDVFERTEHDPGMPSVADVCDFIDSHDPPPLDALNRLLNCPNLSPANRLLLGAKKEIAERAAESTDFRWRGWRQFRVQRVIDEAENIRSFYLAPADNTPLCHARPGQFVTVRLTDKEGQQTVRMWSLSSYTREPETYRITVLRQDGAGSQQLHRCQPGDAVELRAPAGNFTLDMGSFRPLVLIGAGVGITPLMAMLEAQLAKQRPSHTHLFYGARSLAHMAFHESIEAMRVQHENLAITYAFSRTTVDAAHHGRIDLPLVRRKLVGLHVMLDGKRIDLPWFEADFYLCGPGLFCNDMKEALIAGGANPNHIFTEQFVATPTEEASVAEAIVRFAKSKKDVQWKRSDDLSLLELAEEAGIRLESSCRAGACLTCRTRLIEGDTTADLGDGSTLLCLARPKSTALTLDA